MNSTTTSESSNAQNQTLPVIAGHEITVDQHGRFNLNAIHRASGGSEEKRPSHWTRLSQTKELIQELESECTDLCINPTESVTVIESKKGSGGGTYAHELLAISYAGWISPKFQLLVNQVFLDYRMGKLGNASTEALPNPLSPSHQRTLQKAIARRAQAMPENTRRQAYSRLYRHLKDRFEVSSYRDIDDDRFAEALGAVEAVSLEGDLLMSNEDITEPEALSLSADEVSQLASMCYHVRWMAYRWQAELGPALATPGSRHAEECHEHILGADRVAHLLRRQVGRLSKRH